MHRDVFVERLASAARAARDFAREFVEEDLPDELRFRVRLNSSHDGNPLHADENVFLGDGGWERAHDLRACSEEQVAMLLWREGLVPEWINFSVMGIDGTSTLVEAVCCGRFTANEDLLYHQHEGRPPFHSVGPMLPHVYEHGRRFSIYHQSECWTGADIAHLKEHAHKVYSLTLFGDAASDRGLANLPELDRLEVVELHDSQISAGGLRALRRCRRLRVLRIQLSGVLARPHTFHTRDFPELMESMTLNATDEIVLNGAFRDAITDFSITAARVTGDVRLPQRLDSLSLHLRDARASGIERLLAPVKGLGHLSLQGTPVYDILLEKVVARWRLRSLNVRETHVSDEMLRRVKAANPKLRMIPPLR